MFLKICQNVSKLFLADLAIKSNSSGLYCTINIVTALEASFTTVLFCLQRNFTAVKVTAQAARAVNYDHNTLTEQATFTWIANYDYNTFRQQLFRGLYYKTFYCHNCCRIVIS